MTITVSWFVAPSGRTHAFALERGAPDDTSLCGLSTLEFSHDGGGPKCPRCDMMLTGHFDDS